jgi:hypothetical protein
MIQTIDYYFNIKTNYIKDKELKAKDIEDQNTPERCYNCVRNAI